MSEVGTSTVVDCIYDAALNDKRLTELAKVIAEYIDAHSATLTIHTCRMRDFFQARDYFQAVLDIDYTNQFLAQNVWRQTTEFLELTPTTQGGEDTFSSVKDIHTRFYLDHGSNSVPALNALITSDFGVISVAVRRLLNSPDFSPSEASRLQALVPHLQRMHIIRQNVQQLESHSDAARAALDRFAYPIIVVQRDRKILLRNLAAVDVMSRRQVLVDNNGKLSAADPEDLNKLITSINGAFADALGDYARPAEVFYLGDEATDCFRVILLAMADKKSLLVILDDIREPRNINVNLSSLYGLTSAEAALVDALVRGETPESFAQTRNVRMTTVRSQLSSVLRKTETERQSELIALLGRFPDLSLKTL